MYLWNWKQDTTPFREYEQIRTRNTYCSIFKIYFGNYYYNRIFNNLKLYLNILAFNKL